ncbi:MAG TPA: hypothetical protein PLR50_06860, partial [Candidatus Rifleibacterium sp.]|nr:hypothetical protein [Candidatus Rifleibacterium sp.]
SFANNKGKLPWPVIKGAKISDFGNYPHPDVPSVMIENRGIDILVEAGLITGEQLQEALSKQKILGKRLGKVLVETGLTNEDSIANTLASQMNIPCLNLNEVTVPPEVLTTIPDGIVRSHNLLPVRLDGNRLQISMADPLDVFIIDEITLQTVTITVVMPDDCFDLRFRTDGYQS